MNRLTASAGRIIMIALAITMLASFNAEGAKILPVKSGKGTVSADNPLLAQPATNDVKQENTSQAAGNILVDEQIGCQVISSGGILNGRSADYFHSGTINQTAIGSGLSGNLVLKHGFWQTPPNSAAGCCDTPGDANGDGQANVGDAVFLITYVFKGGAAPECLREGDPNGDCNVNVADAVFMVGYCFKDGHTPVCGCGR